ncbi:uncharacterized protein RJT20DRAFT_2149 [Scheffersomyces xylosifermentans]|uniref:uncharacterized protein n=1 Tax=Scheffersomyces xylosifermentans TaxID=1304137 RepID=UPI00315CA5C6
MTGGIIVFDARDFSSYEKLFPSLIGLNCSSFPISFDVLEDLPKDLKILSAIFTQRPDDEREVIVPRLPPGLEKLYLHSRMNNLEFTDMRGSRLRKLVLIHEDFLNHMLLPTNLSELTIEKRGTSFDFTPIHWVSLIDFVSSLQRSRLKALKFTFNDIENVTFSPAAGGYPQHFRFGPGYHYYLIGRNFVFPNNLRELCFRRSVSHYLLKPDVQLPPMLEKLELDDVVIDELTDIRYPKSLKYFILQTPRSRLHSISINKIIFHDTSIQYLKRNFEPITEVRRFIRKGSESIFNGGLYPWVDKFACHFTTFDFISQHASEPV